MYRGGRDRGSRGVRTLLNAPQPTCRVLCAVSHQHRQRGSLCTSLRGPVGPSPPTPRHTGSRVVAGSVGFETREPESFVSPSRPARTQTKVPLPRPSGSSLLRGQGKVVRAGGEGRRCCDHGRRHGRSSRCTCPKERSFLGPQANSSTELAICDIESRDPYVGLPLHE